MRRDRWNTYKVTAYTYQAGNDASATGGVHLHQIRRTPSGWLRRTVDSNGPHHSPGPAESIDDATGETLYSTAKGG